MNVAVTRAKRMCILICDSGTVNCDKFLKGLTTYFKKHGLSRTAFDYQGNPDVRIMYGEKGGAQPPVQQEKKEEEEKKEAPSNNKKLTAAERKKLKKEQQKNSEPEPVVLPKVISKDPPSKDFKLNLNKSDEEQQIEEKIWEFYQNKNQKSMEFPYSFNSYHRHIVHTVADEYGLNHESNGVGKDRKIVITKPTEEENDFKKKLTNGPEQEKELNVSNAQKAKNKKKEKKTLENLAKKAEDKEQVVEAPQIL